MTRRPAPTALVSVLLLSLGAVALGACGGRVDRKDLESKIAAYVKQRTGTDIDVHCPDGVKAKKGTRVRCTTVLSGAPTDIDILFTADNKFRITQTRVRTPLGGG